MLDSDTDEENCLMIDTGIDNAENFKSAWNGNVEEFLKRDDYISVRGTAISEEELMYLNLSFDIDGVSIQWKDIGKGLSLDYTHLTIAPRDYQDIRPIYSVIKKHFNLNNYSKDGLANLKNAFGCQIMYYGGWDTWLAFVPDCTDCTLHTSKMCRDITFANVNKVRLAFQRKLKGLLVKDIATDTLSKNNLDNVKKMFVLPGDREIILSVFQQSLECTELVLPGFVPLLYTFRFGEKCKTPILLPVRDKSGVKDICVHVGINISSDNYDFMWCREGVNNLLGKRGQITSSLSFFECVNFQSNLDGRALGVGRKVLEICRFPDDVRFVQVYLDTPHRRPKTVVHPVSASVILAEGILRRPSQTKLNQDALQYLSEIRNNFNQLREGKCRMEFVVALPRVCRHLDASDLVYEEKLLRLLKEEPMIVPFEKGQNIIGCIREVGLHLCEKLTNAYRIHRGTGDSVAVWQSYQYECAVERLLWGNPFCMTSHIYSVNLGVGLGHPTRSLTDQKGFLCLEDSSACCADENTMPPVTIYTKNVTVQNQITRVFGMYNYLNASSNVAGRRVVMCLIKDLYEAGKVFSRSEEFLLLLKKSSGSDKKRIVGGISITDLSEKLARCPNVKWPMVFGTIKKLLGNDLERISKIVKEGIHALELGYFPAVRDCDESRNPGLNWQYKYGFWVLMDEENRCASYETEAATLHTLVLCELEKWKICHTHQYEQSIFPWHKPILEKIADRKLKREEKVLVLAFLSGVALLMGGSYVDYLNLSRLERKLPITQLMLKMLEVQSKFLLNNIHTFRVWKLHPSIPYKLDIKKKAVIFNPSAQQQQKQVSCEKIRDEDETAGLETIDAENGNGNSDQVDIVRSRHMPTSACHHSVVWSSGELMLLKEAVKECQGNRAQKYRLYQEKCRQKGIPDRTLKAFLRKASRVVPRHPKKK